MKALLFDIDGTLLNTHGAGKRPFEKALADVLGHSFDLSGLDWFGRTDYDIIATLLENHGIPHNEELLSKIFGRFAEYFENDAVSQIDEGNRLPNVKELLSRLEGRALGLVTGNVERVAYLKLSKTGIDRFFPLGVGGFGNERRNRNELVPLAIEKMRKHYSVGEFEAVYVIGDSWRDIECAKSNACVSVAVATGKMDREELSVYAPDYCLEDFKSLEDVLPILI